MYRRLPKATSFKPKGPRFGKVTSLSEVLDALEDVRRDMDEVYLVLNEMCDKLDCVAVQQEVSNEQ